MLTERGELIVKYLPKLFEIAKEIREEFKQVTINILENVKKEIQEPIDKQQTVKLEKLHELLKLLTDLEKLEKVLKK